MKYLSDKCQKFLNNILLIYLLNFTQVRADIDASIDYEVEGNGFHRTIRYHVDTGEFYKENCHIALYLKPDPTLYVNVDELADLRRLGRTTACSDGEIDVEVFAEKAKRQNITVCAMLKESENFLDLPIHQRYQLPRRNEEYMNVLLPEPVLLLGCKERIKEYLVSKIDLCEPCVDLSIKWREIPYKMKTKRYVWMVTVGNLSDLQQVTHITLFTVFFGTIIILRTLWYARNEKGKKRN